MKTIKTIERHSKNLRLLCLLFVKMLSSRHLSFCKETANLKVRRYVKSYLKPQVEFHSDAENKLATDKISTIFEIILPLQQKAEQLA